MNTKPTYAELEHRIKELEQETIQCKRSGQELRISNEKFYRVFLISHSSITMTSLDTNKFVEVNKTFERDFGYSREEAIGKTSLEINLWKNPSDRARMMPLFLKHGYHHEPELQLIKKSGETVVVDIHFSIMHIGGETFSITSFNDITERKQAEEELKQSEERFRTMMEQSPLAIEITRPDGQISEVNSAWLKLWNFPEEDLPQFLEKYNRFSDKQIINKGLIPLFEKAQAGEPVDIPAIRDDAAKVLKDLGLSNRNIRNPWIQGRLYPVKRRDGELQCVVAIYEDITERKQAEEALGEAHKELVGKNKCLEESYIALKVLMEQQAKDKKNLEKQMLFNVKSLIDPYLEKLKDNVSGNEQKTYIEIVEKNLNEIVLPFAPQLGSNLSKLTPAEIKIADLIRHGKSNKEIAAILNLSPATITTHRQRMRKKLGITNQKTNLRTILS